MTAGGPATNFWTARGGGLFIGPLGCSDWCVLTVPRGRLSSKIFQPKLPEVSCVERCCFDSLIAVKVTALGALVTDRLEGCPFSRKKNARCQVVRGYSYVYSSRGPFSRRRAGQAIRRPTTDLTSEHSDFHAHGHKPRIGASSCPPCCRESRRVFSSMHRPTCMYVGVFVYQSEALSAGW